MNMIGDLDANGEGGSHVGAKQDGARNLLAHLPSKHVLNWSAAPLHNFFTQSEGQKKATC